MEHVYGYGRYTVILNRSGNGDQILRAWLQVPYVTHTWNTGSLRGTSGQSDCLIREQLDRANVSSRGLAAARFHESC